MAAFQAAQAGHDQPGHPDRPRPGHSLGRRDLSIRVRPAESVHAGEGTEREPLVRDRPARAGRVHPCALRRQDLAPGRAHRSPLGRCGGSHRRRHRRLLRRLDRQHPDARDRPLPVDPVPGRPDHRRECAGGQPLRHRPHPVGVLLDAGCAHRAGGVPVDEGEGVRRGRSIIGRLEHADHLLPHASERHGADHRQRHAFGGGGHPHGVRALLPRVRGAAAHPDVGQPAER